MLANVNRLIPWTGTAVAAAFLLSAAGAQAAELTKDLTVQQRPMAELSAIAPAAGVPGPQAETQPQATELQPAEQPMAEQQPAAQPAAEPTVTEQAATAPAPETAPETALETATETATETVAEAADTQIGTAPNSTTKVGMTVTVGVDRPDGVYKIGDKVVLSVAVDMDAYVTVFNTGTSGQVHVIFPNEFQQDNHVLAGAPVLIPSDDADFDFIASGPPGTELITVVASTNPDSLVQPGDTVAAGPFQAYTQVAEVVAKDLQITLEAQHRDAWAETTYRVLVLPDEE
jgi:hypothetical protein